MRNRLLGLALVVSLGLNIGLLWQRFGGDTEARHRERGVPCGWQSSPLRSLLGLSDRQVEAMERERRQLLAQVAPRQQELRGKRLALLALCQGSTTATPELDRLLQEIAGLQVGIERAFIEHSLRLKVQFTPSQRQKYESLFGRGLCPGMIGKMPLERGDKDEAAHSCQSGCREDPAANHTGIPNKEVLPEC